MITPQWYLAAGENFFADLHHAPRLGEPAETHLGEIAYHLGDESGFSPAQTVGATHLALIGADHLLSTMDHAAQLHQLTELARLVGGLNLLHAYLTQTIHKIAAQVSNRTFPDLAHAPADATAAVSEHLTRAGSHGEHVAGHLAEAVVALRALSATSENGHQMNTAPVMMPTTYGQEEGFDYDTFTFSEAFPVPHHYVVIAGTAHFRGPDGHLWFAPDALGNEIQWGCPHNIAAWDTGNYSHAPHDPSYLAVIAEICAAVDAASATDHRYLAWIETDRAATTTGPTRDPGRSA